METVTTNSPVTCSVNVAEDNLARLRQIFPDAFKEGKIDLDTLRELLGDRIDEGEEKFGLNWHGKRQARRLALTPSSGTLRPCREESVAWEATKNLMIEGDNLEVLKLLQKSYSGKVKLIYIDPPYNTGKDFIYPDNYKDGIKNYLKLTGQVDGDGQKLSSNTEASGRFHTTWLNMMLPRLKLARNLLRSDGVILISIDENESSNLRAICNEIFGEENFVCEFVWKKKSGGGGDVGSVVIDHEYILCYGRSSEPGIKNDPAAEVTTQYNKIDDDGRRYSLDRLDKQSLGYQESLDFPIEGPNGRTYSVVHKDPDHKVARWRWGKETVRDRHDELVFEWPYVYTKNYEKSDGAKPRDLLVDKRFGRTRSGKTDLKKIFGIEVMDFPKPVRLMKHLLNIAMDEGDIVLDFFAGSCPMGQAVLESSTDEDEKMRFIMVQFPEPVSEKSQNGKNALSMGCNTVADIGIQRMKRVAEKLPGEKIGFRVFKLDSSNIRAWEQNPSNLDQALLDSVNNIKDERSELDVLFELLLKTGLDLCAPIEEREIAGKKIYIVDGGTLIACLDDSVSNEEAETLALGIAKIRDSLENATDGTVIFLDSAFTDDVAKTNATEILRQYGFKNIQSV